MSVLIVVLAVLTTFAQTERKAISIVDPGRPFIKCWEIKNSDINSFASDNNTTIIFDKAGNISRFNTKDKTYLWRISIGNKTDSRIFIQGRTTFIFSKRNNSNNSPTEKFEQSLRLLDLETGITNRILPLDQTESWYLIVDDQSKNVILISESLDIQSLDLLEGKSAWKTKLEGKPGLSTNDSESIYILNSQNKLFQIKKSDGSLQNQKQLTTKNITAILNYKGVLLAGSRNGTLYKISENPAEQTKLFRAGGEISQISLLEDKVLVVSQDNFLYLYSIEDRKVIWKKRLSGRVLLKPQILKNSVLITTLSEPEIYVLDLNDGSFINRINLGDEHIIRDIQTNEKGVLVLTNKGIVRFTTENCGT